MDCQINLHKPFSSIIFRPTSVAAERISSIQIMFNVHYADIPHNYKYTVILLKLLFSISIKNN